MLNQESIMEIHILHKQGLGIKAISKKLGVSRNTVRKYLREEITSQKKVRRSRSAGKLSSFKPYIKERVEAAYPDRIPATVLIEEIKPQGYTGSISLLRNYIYSILLSKTEPSPVARYETPAGKQMQVDWAEFRRGKDRLYGFIATLGYSRMSYVIFTTDMKIETLLECIEQSFDYFGGIPKRVLFDNMKTAVIQRNAYGKDNHKYNSRLWDFAKHHGFLPRLCAPYRPQTKGKVERFIGYLRKSFYIPLKVTMNQAGLSLDSITANTRVKYWLNNTANTRVHATTKEVPFVRWEEEKRHMAPYIPYLYISNKNEEKASKEKTDHKEILIQHDLSVYQQLLTH